MGKIEYDVKEFRHVNGFYQPFPYTTDPEHSRLRFLRTNYHFFKTEKVHHPNLPNKMTLIIWLFVRKSVYSSVADKHPSENHKIQPRSRFLNYNYNLQLQ